MLGGGKHVLYKARLHASSSRSASSTNQYVVRLSLLIIAIVEDYRLYGPPPAINVFTYTLAIYQSIDKNFVFEVFISLYTHKHYTTIACVCAFEIFYSRCILFWMPLKSLYILFVILSGKIFPR